MSTITTAALSHGYGHGNRNRVKTIGGGGSIGNGLKQYDMGHKINNSNSQIKNSEANGQYRINRSHQNMHIIVSEQRVQQNN